MTDIEKLIAGPSKEAYGSDVEELLWKPPRPR